MEFKMNGETWTIKEVEQEEFWKDDNELDKMNSKEYYFGRCKFATQEIWLWANMADDIKKKTLYHELMHCYRGCYITLNDFKNCDEDFVCDLTANSHDIIHKIVEDYMGKLTKC